MKAFRRVMAGLLFVLVVQMFLVEPVCSQEKQKIIIVGACEFNKGYIYSRILRKFSDEILKHYKGDAVLEFDFKYKSKRFSGKEKDLAILLKRNVIDFAILAPSHAENISKSVTFLDIPYLFKNEHHLESSINSGALELIEKDLLGSIDNPGLRIVGYAGGGVRNIFSISKIGINEMKGLEIRVMDSEIQQSVFSILGLNPRPMPYRQLFNGLKNKFVHAAENKSSSLAENRYYEVAPFLLQTKHAYTVRPIFFSEARFSRFPDDLKLAIVKAGNVAGQWGRNQERKLDRRLFDLLRFQNKIVVTTVSSKKIDELRNRVRPIHSKYARAMGIENVLNKIEAALSIEQSLSR